MVKRSSKKNASSNQQQRQRQQQQQQQQHEQRKIPAFTRLIFGVLVIYEITFVIFSSNSQQRSNFMSKFEFAPPSSSSSSLAATATTYDVSNKAVTASASAAVTAPSEKSNNNNINNNSEQDDALLSYSNTIIINDVYKYQPPKIDSRGNENNGCGASPDFNIWSSIPRVYNRSHHGEDIIIYNLFFKDHIYNNNNVTAATGDHHHDEVMTYVELGAFDGIRESNTHFYDYCLGWKGLLLEGNPVKYKDLLINRPNSHKMNFAPSCNDWNTTVTFFTSEKTNAGIKHIAKGYNSNRNNDIEHDVPWYVTLRYVTFHYRTFFLF
jgi:hypothetical protein